MGDSDVVRQKRHKYHRRGDHSLCVVGRCEAITAQDRVNALGPQGREVWDGVVKHDKLTAIQRVILLEFCRNVDRLDALNGQINGQPLAELVLNEKNPAITTVVVTAPLGEARQIQGVQKVLASELRLSGLTGGLGGQPKRPVGRPRKDAEPAVPAQPGGASDATTGNVVAIASRIAAIRRGETQN